MSYGASLEEMRRAAGDVRNVGGDVDARLRSLLNQVDAVKSFWKGDASKAFQGLMDEWNRDARRLHDALLAIASTLDKTNTNYAIQEETHASSMTGIREGLDS